MGLCSSKVQDKHTKWSEIRKFSKLNIHQFYHFSQILGSGNFGTVKLHLKKQLQYQKMQILNQEIQKIMKINFSLEQKINGLQSKSYAVKSIAKHQIVNRLHLIQKELEILVQLDRPNIIRVYETFEDLRYYHFVMEYCRGGELFERIVRKCVFSGKR